MDQLLVEMAEAHGKPSPKDDVFTLLKSKGRQDDQEQWVLRHGGFAGQSKPVSKAEIDALERQGFIARQRSSPDGDSADYKITQRGFALAAGHRP